LTETCLPGLYPREGMPANSPPSEKKVYDALADALPAGWYAWHSVKIRTEDGDDTEADFIIASPGAMASTSPSASPGILILEVKGGAISKRDGQWYQGGRSTPMPKAPRDQAIHCRKALLTKFIAHRLPPPAIGEAVIFPDQDYDAPPTQGDLEGLVLGARELPYLKELLPDFMRRAIPLHFRRDPGAGWIALLHNIWCAAWPLKPNLAFQARARLDERVKLDATQFAALSGALENDLVLVHGNAGTGKTLLASALARHEAASGRTVLFLTYTEALGHELAASLSAAPAPSLDSAPSAVPSPSLLITVSPIGRFALAHLRGSGFADPEQPAPLFWEGVTRLAARSQSLWKNCRFDTVIIDEAQDFGADEWRIATQCSARPHRIWVFMDESQAFWEKRTLPRPFLRKCARLDLGKPYRCPPGIQALADAYLGKAAPNATDSLRLALDDGTIGITCSERDKVHEDVGKEINRLLAEGFKPSDIAVISLRGRMFDQNIMHRKELGGRAVVQATDDRAKDHIVCETFLRYKGLERLAVIVTDLLRDSEKYTVRVNNPAASRGALRAQLKFKLHRPLL
jgi:hypothetical protein